MKIARTLIALFAFFNVACDHSGSGGGSSSNTVSAVNASSGIEGTWASACTESNNVSTELVVNFGDTTYKATFNTYNTVDCSGVAIIQNVYTGSFAVGAASAQVSGATNVNLTLDASALVTPLYPAIAYSLNQTAFCGFTNWQSGVTESVDVGNACVSEAISLSGPALFQILNGQLYVGSASDTSMDYSDGFARVN